MSSFIIFCTFLVLLQFCKRTRNKAFSEPRNNHTKMFELVHMVTSMEDFDFLNVKNWLLFVLMWWTFSLLGKRAYIDNCLFLFLLWVLKTNSFFYEFRRMCILPFLPWASETVSFAFSELILSPLRLLVSPFGKMIFNGIGYNRLVR